MKTFLVLFSFLFVLQLKAEGENTEKVLSIAELCESSLRQFAGSIDEKALKAACAKASILDGCQSVNKVPIFHYEKKSKESKAQNVLVFSLIHGDETPAGAVGRFWIERLENIEPRNNWRVVPILNPDGTKLKTRTNANKVDVNRNFPTQDWEKLALATWKKETKSNPRRYPGDKGGSEPETQCAVKHIDDFKPDFMVSVHTPLKVLDFDGPKVKPPKYDYLPWKALGNYPGSLGRYMWLERQVPLLTMELKEDIPETTEPLTQLQDIVGVLVGLELNPPKHKTTEKPVIPKRQ